MDRLFVANCTKQDHVFVYMLKGDMRPYRYPIRAGQQVEIPCRDGVAQQIIDQHKVYGMQEATGVARGFSGLAYRLNKQISLEAILIGFEQRDDEVNRRAQEAQKATAVAADKLLDDAAQQSGARPVGELEVQVTEEPKGPTETKGFDQTIQVQKPGIDRRARRR